MPESPTTPSAGQQDIMIDKPGSSKSSSRDINPAVASNKELFTYSNSFPPRNTIVEQDAEDVGSGRADTSCDTFPIDIDEGEFGIDPFDDEFDAQLEDNDLGLIGAKGDNGEYHVNEGDGEEGDGEEGDGEEGDDDDDTESEGEDDGKQGNSCKGGGNGQPSTLHCDLPTSSCAYKGYFCQCVPDNHEYDPHLPSSSIAHVDEACKILESLNLKFHKRHRYLICTCGGGSFVALQDLKSHIKKKHKTDLRDENTRTMRRDFDPALKHISTSFKLSMSQKPVDFDKEAFDGPIAGIEKPKRCHFCPSPGCKSICTSMQSLKAHHFKAHGSTEAFNSNSVRIRWTQHPFASRFNRSPRVEVDNSKVSSEVLRSPGQNHSGSSKVQQYIVPQGIAAVSSPWLDHVGWTSWRNDLLRTDHTISGLRALVSLPKQIPKRRLQASHWPPTGDILLFLISSWIHVRLEKMLEDANTWLDGSELRSAITIE